MLKKGKVDEKSGKMVKKLKNDVENCFISREIFNKSRIGEKIHIF